MELEFTNESKRRKRIIAAIVAFILVAVVVAATTTAILLTRQPAQPVDATGQNQNQNQAPTFEAQSSLSSSLSDYVEPDLVQGKVTGNDKKNVLYKHTCSHDQRNSKKGKPPGFISDIDNIKKLKLVKKPDNKSEKRSLQGTTIRITNDYSLLQTGADTSACTSSGQVISNIGDGSSWTCTANDVATAARVTDAQSVIAEATSFIQTFLQMHSTTANLVLSGVSTYKCGSGTIGIPTQYQTATGTPTDFIMLWTLRACRSSSTLAYAGACLSYCLDGTCTKLDRPLVGQGNLCPVLFSNNLTDTYSRNYVKRVVVHEFLHALGFTSQYFNSYFDKNTGLPYTNGVVTASSVNGTSTINTKFLQTPNLLNFARSYTGCSDTAALTGIPMENGDSGSHFEDTFFHGEIMSPIATHGILSGFTLSLLNDMGWYDAVMSVAERKRYGYKEGCGFLTQKCNSQVPSTKFCVNGTVQCDRERLHGGVCRSALYTSALPGQWQYFPNAQIGGTSSFSDYCMRTTHYSNVYCDKETGQLNAYNGVSGPNSACFDITISGSRNVACYPWRCYASATVNLTLQVKPSNSATWINCPTGGSFLYGTVTITCPSPVGVFCDGVPPSCDPSCTGKCGGSNGCGGTCPATCPSGQTCNTTTSTCVSTCTPNCAGKCGGSNGCGGTCPTTCPSGQTCNTTTSTCVSTCTTSCTGKCGGSDGCGGTCPATCPSGQTCNTTTSTCVSTCTPSCTGKCGGSNGCGGTCAATCPSGQTCNTTTLLCVTCTASCAGRCGGVSNGCGGTCSSTCIADSSFTNASTSGRWTASAGTTFVTNTNCPTTTCAQLVPTSNRAVSVSTSVGTVVQTAGGCSVRFRVRQTTTSATSALTASYRCSGTTIANISVPATVGNSSQALVLPSNCNSSTFTFSAPRGVATWFLDDVTVC